jgi:hypothetical protein
VHDGNIESARKSRLAATIAASFALGTAPSAERGEMTEATMLARAPAHAGDHYFALIVRAITTRPRADVSREQPHRRST